MPEPQVTQLGRYRITDELGRGAMGVVYRAQDTVLERTVAIKTILLSSDISERDEYEARFLQEAKAAGRLNHPGIITIYDVGRDGDLAYMAMEMLEGADLRTRMREGRIPVPDAIDIVEQLAEALAFAHERGVVHRDIKPANIMLVNGGRIKIMDFGIARMRISDLKTRTGMLLGTPKYMSPEQVAGRPLDHRSDIFSLGIVLHEILTNASLFSGSDTTQVLNNVANLQALPPSRVNREVPPMLDLVVAKTLEKDAEARYQDAADLAGDLRACLHELAQNSSTGADTVRTVRMKAADATQTGSGESIANRESDKTVRVTLADAAVDSSTILPFSRRFDSSQAAQHLASPSSRRHIPLSRTPRPPSAWQRVVRDSDLRLMVGLIAAGLVSGILLAVI